MTDTLVIRSQEPPAQWVGRLREIDPIREQHSYLAFRWHGPSQRWTLYEMVPAHTLSDAGVLAALKGPNPETLSEADHIASHQAGVSAYQWEAFRETGRYARPSWIIQGTKGGHLAAYDEPTKELCKAVGLPMEPPAPGALCYAPFDERVVRQILKMNRLAAAKNDLAELHRQSTTDAWKRQVRQRKQEARAQMVQFLNDQMEEAVPLFQDAYAKGEYEAVDAPIIDANRFQEQDERETAHFIEHGTFT